MMRLGLGIRTCLWAVAGAVFSVPGQGMAQQRNSADAPALGTIIVTARQYGEPLRQVPISMTALGADELERIGAVTLADVARSVPGLVVAPVGVLGSEQPAIRGVFSPTGSSTVGLYVDDVPIQIRSLGFAGNADLRTFDLIRVEVLRGPQGTLFGAGSMGGTIRFITRQPDLDETDVRLSGEIRQTRDGGLGHEVRAAFGTPIVPGGIGFRAGFYYRRDAGYVDRVSRSTGTVTEHDVNNVSAFALRAGIKVALGERGDVTPAILYQKSRRRDYPFFENTLGPHRQRLIHEQPGKDAFILPSLTARFDLGGASLTSVTALLDRDDRQITDYSTVFGELVLGGVVPGLVPEGGSRSFSRVGQRSFTQEIRLASSKPDPILRWVVGGFYQRSRLTLTQTVVEPGIAALTEEFLGLPPEAVFGVPLLPGGVSYRGTERVRETQFAVFGEAVWRMDERLEAVAGLRITQSRLGLRVASEGPYAGGLIAAPEERPQRETPVTPRLGLTYHAGPDSLAYVSVSKGFRVGGANPPVPSGPCAADLRALGRAEAPVSFSADGLWSYEAGLKTAFVQRRLSMSVSLFQVDWRGIQQLLTLPDCGFSFTDNLGAARNRGFEWETEARPIPRLQLTTALGFVDARFRTTVLGSDGVTGHDRTIIAASGDRVPYVPRWTVRLAANYDLALPDELRGYLRGEYQFVGAYRRAPSRDAIGYDARVYEGDSYGTLLVRAGVARGAWQLSMFVENLLDDRSVLFSSADLVPVTGTPLRQKTLPPRAIGITGGVRF